MHDSFFRTLNAEEEEAHRQWARDNWADHEPEYFWHPVVRDEWRKISARHHAYAGAQ